MLTGSDNSSYGRQWYQLILLTAAHFVMDMFPGMMHTVLPALQKSFGLTVASGAFLLTVFLIAANLSQVLIGHLRPDKERPLYLYAGLALSCSILLFGLVSKNNTPLLWLSAISILAGLGVGLSHPEGLRAVHRLEKITSAVSSSVFMAGGVFGFAFGGVVSTYLYEHYGVMGMAPLCGITAVVLFMNMVSGIKLAVEQPKTDVRQDSQEVPFWTIMAIAILAMGSVQVLMWIVPQHLSRIGAELTLGGKTVSMFMLAGGIGGIWWARSAARRGELKTILVMLVIGLPFFVVYMFTIGLGTVSALVLATGGFFCYGSYPIMVSIARRSRGPNLGRRMGLIVGGIWLMACLLPMMLGPVAQRWGTTWILYLSPIGFVAALLLVLRQPAHLRNH